MKKNSPLAHAQLVLSDALHLHMEVTEVPSEDTAGSLDMDDSVLDREGHVIGEGHDVRGLDLLHDTLKDILALYNGIGYKKRFRNRYKSTF